MTISTTESRIIYTGNGSTTSFSVPFDFDDDTDLKVELITTSTKDVVLQTLNTDYTISSTNVVMTSAPASTQQILITLDLDFEQATNYIANDPFPAETHEDALDELAKQIKQLKHQIDYNIPKLPSNTLTATTVTDTDIKAKYVFNINSSADAVELNTVENLIDINGLTDNTIVAADEIMFADASDSWNPKKDTVQGIIDLAKSASAAGAVIEVDGTQQNDNVPTLDFDGTDFTLTESPTDDFDITINAERIQDIVGGMVSSNTETLITVTYEDSDGTIDFVVDNDLSNYDNTTSAFLTGITAEPLSDLSDVTITSIASGEVLKWNGSAWVNNTLAEAGIAAASHTHSTSDITSGTFDDARIAESNVTQHQAALSITESQISDLSHTTDTYATIQVDGVAQSTNAPTLDFDGTDFTLTESPTDDFDVTINVERIQDIAGAMVTGNTETGITVTYQDADGTIDFTVSDLTVAGDTGSTGMTPGDTLTIAGGTNCTTAMSADTLTVNVDDAFLSNAGDSGTGTYSITGDLTVDNLTFNGNVIGSSTGDITLTPNGTSNVTVGNYTFDADQTVGAGQDNYVLTYDNSSGLISLEASAGGGGGGADQGLATVLGMIF